MASQKCGMRSSEYGINRKSESKIKTRSESKIRNHKSKIKLIYDGECAFCTRNTERLQKFVGARLERVSSHAAGALDLHPTLTRESTQARVYLLFPDARIFGGAEAVARALALSPLGKFALAYYLPGVAPLCEWLYQVIARNRSKLSGLLFGGSCDGACSLPQHK